MQAGQKIECKQLTLGYNFPPTHFRLDREKVVDYINAVEDHNNIYREHDVVPPMATAALAMAAMSSGLEFPDGAMHVSQNLGFYNIARTGEALVSYARVTRIIQRNGLYMLFIGIDVKKQDGIVVLSGETCFVLLFLEGTS